MIVEVVDDQPRVVRSAEEDARVLKSAREAKTMIIAVAALAIGSMIFMFLIMLVIIFLKVL
jgi:hypothetical protein